MWTHLLTTLDLGTELLISTRKQWCRVLWGKHFLAPRLRGNVYHLHPFGSRKVFLNTLLYPGVGQWWHQVNISLGSKSYEWTKLELLKQTYSVSLKKMPTSFHMEFPVTWTLFIGLTAQSTSRLHSLHLWGSFQHVVIKE